MKRIEGIEAIEYAEKKGKKLNKYADPTEAPRQGLTVDEAREIASEDPSLIYLDIDFGLKEAREILENMDELDYDELEPMYEWFIGSPLVDGGEPGETLTEYDMYSELCQALEVFGIIQPHRPASAGLTPGRARGEVMELTIQSTAT